MLKGRFNVEHVKEGRLFVFFNVLNSVFEHADLPNLRTGRGGVDFHVCEVASLLQVWKRSKMLNSCVAQEQDLTVFGKGRNLLKSLNCLLFLQAAV